MNLNENLKNKTIVGKIKKVIFLDSKSGRTILSVIREDGKNCRVIGNINGIEKDYTISATISATGTWKKDEKYGWQFLAESIEILSPKEVEFVDDGLIHAMDFSNILSTKHKEFRNVALDIEYGTPEPIERPSDNDNTEQNKNIKSPVRKTEVKQHEETIVVDGAVYSKDMTKLISAPKDQSHFSIPNSVISIETCAFIGSIIESIHIPDSVIIIKNAAFIDCSKLTTILLPSSVESIGDTVFTGCQSLMAINVETGNKEFCDIDGILYNHDLSQLIYVPNGLSYVTISESTTTIKYGAFDNCFSLNEIIVTDGNMHFKTIEGILYNFDATKIIYVPRKKTNIKLPDTITSIAESIFAGNEQLRSISIPKNVTNIENKAFYGCTKLSYIGIPNSVTSIGKEAFYGCSNLTSISIPDSVTHIGQKAFMMCNGLKIVKIPKGVTEIGERAFYGCDNLVVDILNTDIKIGENAFSGCKLHLEEITMDIEWKNVTFLKGYVNVPALLGGWTKIKDENVDSSVNSLRKHLTKMMPCLTVHFDQDGIASIVNEKELHDAVITLKIKNDLAALIKEGYHPAEILKRIDGLSPKYIREFIPRDMTPYINFLLSKHAADRYPIVPIVEYIGGSREEGALYTLMIDGQPNIVWENNNDARSTYVFRCTEENYQETRQLVFDYIMVEEIGKRKLLHTDNCMKIFMEKPRMVIHNNLKSWTQRLMCDSELT